MSSDVASAPPRGRSELIWFLAMGAVAATVNIVSRIVFNLIVSYKLAILLAYLCGMATAFLLFRNLVFPPSRLNTRTQLLRFTSINMVALAQVWLVSVGLAEFVFPAIGLNFHAHMVAHLIGVLCPVFTSYLGHKWYSFDAR